jgi:hypothetical protein
MSIPLTYLRQRNNLPTGWVSVAVLHECRRHTETIYSYVHEHEFYGRSTGRYVPLTHSASSFTRALVMTSFICDAFIIRQVKVGQIAKSLHEPT